MLIRQEEPEDHASIRRLIAEAFAGAPHSSGSEADIVDALRAGDALWLSLVALEGARIVGHAALSPVAIDGAQGSWLGLGPVAVRPAMQRRGVGRALIERALDTARAGGADGCVVLGDPRYYGRFGFEHRPDLTFAGAPTPYFQALVFNGGDPRGSVTYDRAFA